ncbi:DUF4105 domain-containing protein [Defluviimonas sp. D31]|uniref:Lnb N-terminal periplasmic domain-containing protein n=1 Tax=Defluviimonas sp. D31 TaxID=3083253 RepID=UPI00296F15AE|nr:DUF4105 domain-containing protein [Defluviimonas sp. D31]MDW4548110.1 DUF4105 domain-containing protein [Defluviimonas sp. D31]
MVVSIAVFAGRVLQIGLAAGLLGWTALLGHFQLGAPWRQVFAALIAVLLLGLFVLLWRREWRRVWIAMGLVLVAAGLWWGSLEPRADRDWKPEVAHGVTAEIGPERVTLHNVRNFGWTSETEAAERWETRVVDPGAVASVDIILSVWDSPDIAHTLVSFGFEDGQHVVFSSEIRKERDEEFSSLGGFFREFELVLIAADERDIVRLRTDMRGEQVSLYPITMEAEQRERLFLSFLELGNDLDRAPRWYNTLTSNCTTVPYHLAAQLSDRVVFDPRVILSGRLPGYLRDIGVLRPDLTAEEVAERASLGRLGPALADGAEFSRRMRTNWDS